MVKVTTLSLALAALSGSVSAHGYLRYLDYKGVTYGMWEPFSDPFYNPLPLRYDRTIADNGPVYDMTGPNITCNNGGNNPANVGIVEVAAGDTVTLVWDQWGSSHSGPVMTYMAKCTPNCASFKGDTGSPWFKIDQMGYDPAKNPPWGSDYLARQGAWWKVTIPSSISAGEYLLRHEILGLHVAGTVNGAQFYPSCVHLRVTGGGSANPSGVSLPGDYDPNDADGILIQLWQVNQGIKIYTPPGGPVWTGAAPGPQSLATPTSAAYAPKSFAPSVRGAATTSTTTLRTTTTSPTTSRTTTTAVVTTTSRTTTPVTTSRTTTTSSRTTTTTSRTTTTGSTGGAAQWAQCGGSGFTGPTTCVSPYTCVVLNPYYSQCQ
ncbi:Endoglucanase-4 [Dactylella cylindrospora]|nr:Endoglucanase-4 [Dactylella cylindrospora]